MQQEFVGLQHYWALFTEDQVFLTACVHSLIWAIAGPAVELSLAFTMALLLYSQVPGWRVFRVAWFGPMLLSGVVIGIIWRWIYNYDWGAVNMTLRTIGLGALADDWLGNPTLAFPALIVVTSWMFTGFNMVLTLAAMSSIPGDLVEAAQVDGASTWRTVRHIIFPLLQRTLVNLGILSFIGKMQQFEVVWIMTRGGPMWGTETVATYVYKRAFQWRTLDLGYPSAIAVVWFIAILGLTLILTRYLQKREVLEF
ncbi:MAG: carbohydrate ABC transporter permease [Chloroflexota bacterium]